MVIKGKGMPVTPTTRKRFGDIIIHFRIDFPKAMRHLERKEINQLKTLLPVPDYPLVFLRTLWFKLFGIIQDKLIRFLFVNKAKFKFLRDLELQFKLYSNRNF